MLIAQVVSKNMVYIWSSCLLDWLLERIRDRVPRAISPNKPPIKRFSQSIPSIAPVTEFDTINSDQSSTKSRRILDFDRLTLYVHVFFSIRSNSPHNGPLGPLCGWVFHIEGRQRRPNSRLTVLEIFCLFYANAALARQPHTISILGWRHLRTNVSWVKIQCCFVAAEQIEFLPSYKSHLSWKRAIARQAWVSECYQFSFLFRQENWEISLLCQILFGIGAQGCRYGNNILHRPWWKMLPN